MTDANIAKAIDQAFGNSAEDDFPTANVVDGLFAIAHALDGVATALQNLGNASASTPFGAIEHLGMMVAQSGEAIASALSTGLTEIADAMPPSAPEHRPRDQQPR